MRSNRFYSDRVPLPPEELTPLPSKRKVLVDGVVTIIDAPADEFLSHVRASDFSLSAAVESGNAGLLRDLGSVAPDGLAMTDRVSEFANSLNNIKDEE